MKIRYLGTAAAEAIPAMFCDCETCCRTRAAGGRNIRSRSQALIDGKLLIDYPPDTFYHCLRDGLNLTDISHCLITHVHEDHLYAWDFAYLRPGYSHPHEGYVFHLYGSEDVAPFVEELPPQTKDQLQYHPVAPFVPFAAGDYTVTALNAHHGTPHPYIYIVSDGKKTMLYAHDTGPFLPETVAYLQNSGVRFDLVSLDCTGGSREKLSYFTHMCIGFDKECRAMLKSIGAADEKTVFVLNHFSHNDAHVGYDEFAPMAEKEGFVTSYDGMEIEF